MNWKDIETKCTSIVTDCIIDLMSGKEEKETYVYSLYTDSGAMSVSFGANSKGNLEKKLSNNESYTPEDIAYFKWDPAEWDYEGYEAERFIEINKELSNSKNRDNFESFFKKLIETMTASLVEAKKNSEAMTKNATFFVTVTDNDAAEEIENASAQIINTPDIANSFLKRYAIK